MRVAPALPRSRRVRACLYFSVLALLAAGLVVPKVNHAQSRLLTAIAVTPANPTLTVSQVEPFSAQGTFNDASTEALGAGGGTWAPSASLTTPRFYHTATRLQDGSVLVVGGYNGTTNFASAERYYPASNTWQLAGSMTLARNSHTATLLPNGKVLVAGGIQYSGASGTLTNTAEIYDPFSNSWSPAAPLTLGPRSSHSAVLLGNGKVLVTAGLFHYPDCTYLATSELYDYLSNTWAPTGSLSLRRSSATTTLLQDGKVLIAGGPANGCPGGNPGMNEAEVYDPAFGTWAVVGNLSVSRYANSITVLPSGKVLLAGGASTGGAFTTSADLFNPSTQTFSFTGSLGTARVTSVGVGDNGAMPLLQNGQVLFTGGSSSGGLLASAELYNPASGTWSSTGSLATPRTYHTSTLLDDGRVLVVGGSGSGGALASAELYSPKLAWTSSNASVATIDPITGVATAVATGTTTITATSGSISGTTTLTVAVDTEAPTTNASAPAPNSHGWNNFNVDVSLNAFDTGGAVPASGVESITYALTGAQTGGGTINASNTLFTISTEGTTTVTYFATDNRGNVETPHTLTINLDKTQPTLAPLPNITVNGTSPAGAVVTFNPVTFDALSGVDTVLATQGLPSGATFPYGTTTEQVTVTDNAGNNTLRNFSVTVSNTLVSIAVSPSTATLTPTHSSQQFTATGTYSDGSTPALSVSGGTWSASASLATPRLYHSATRLQDGSVLVAGGYNGTTTFASAERYYPASNTWVPAGSMARERISHSATLLPNGKVLVVGGRRPNDLMYDTTELYDPATNSWAPGPSLHLGVRSSHSAVLLGNGKVLVAAGLQSYPDCTYRTDAELYDSTTNTWTTTGSLHLARGSATATLLANGNVLLAAGPANNCPSPNYGMNEAEVYDPVSGAWAVTGNLSAPRYGNSITVLPNGKILLAGGYSAGTLATADVYDPAAGTFSLTGSLGTARMTSSGTGDNGATPLLQNGLVLFAGGSNDSGILASAELYNPASGAWTPTGSATVANNALWVFGANGSTQMFRLAIGQLPSGWSTLGGGLTGRGQAGAATVGDVAYVIGGQVNGAAVATVEAFSAPPPSDLAVNTGGGGGGGGSSSLPAVQWQSQNTGVATINSSGFATGTGPGQTNIVASACPTTSTCDPAARISGSATLTVIPPTFVTFTLAPGSLTPPGNQVSITLSQPPSPDSHTEVVTLGQAESVDKPGTVHVVFNPPTGYTVSPAERDVTINAGDNLSVPLFFALIDTIPPVLTVSNNVTAEATSAAGAAVTFATATATDAGSGVQSVSCDRAPGDAFPIGTTTVSCSATDNNGNTANASFTVSVVDTTPPVLTLLGANPMTVEGGATFTDPGATATDVVAGTLTAQIHVTGSVNTAVVGTYSLTYAVSDGHGNTTTATRTVNVVDTTKPTLNLPANITVDATSPAGAVVVYSVSATDIVSGAVSVNCSKLSGSTFPIGTTAVTCSATDAANNTVNGTFTVLVQAAAAQVSNLTVTVESFNLVQGIQNSLDTKLQNVLSALSAAVGGNVTNVCNQMSAFINETTAQSGKKLTVAQANQLLVSAQQIRAVIGCQ